MPGSSIPLPNPSGTTVSPDTFFSASTFEWEQGSSNQSGCFFSTVAATEVGYLGIRATHINVIDLAGLNDTDIALHGFDLPRFLARKPDLIWMPNTAYTYQRGLMFYDPAFLTQYDVYAGAGNYGIALRKDSPVRSQIDRQLATFWTTVYPGTNPSAYLVHSATWTGQKHSVPNN